MKHASWALLAVIVIGCQGETAKPPAASYAAAEPLPPEVASLLEQGDYAAALARVDALIAGSPDNALLYSVRSTVHHRQGHNDDAVKDLNRAIELNAGDPRLFNNRGFVLMGMQQFSAAQADFDLATQLAPEYSNPYNNRGLLKIAQGQFASAIEQLDQALRLDPDYVDAYNNRGFAEFQLGLVDAALADFNKAIKLNPKYVNAFNNRGLLRARVGDLENAVVDFTSAMMLDPLNPKYYEHRREVYRRMSAIDLALADEARHDWLVRLQTLTAAIHSAPKTAGPLVDRAHHHWKADDPARAMEDVDRALALDPKLAAARLLRGRIYLELNEFQKALEDAEAILESGARQEAYSLKGDACLGLKDYDRAIESFAEARRIDAAVAEAYYRKSQVLQASGQADEAADTLQRAVALDPAVEDRLR